MEEKLLLIQRENQILRIQLEATREAGIQASQKIHGNFRIREEELRKSWEKEKEKLQASNLQQEENLGKILENSKFLEESMREKQLRIQRMEEEKQTLIQRKISLEKQLPMLKNKGLPQFQGEILEFQREIPELQDRIQHLQRLIQDQHRGLRNLIQEREELNSKLRIQEEKIQDLSEKLEALEFQNQDLKKKLEFWAGNSKAKISKGVWTGIPWNTGITGSSLLLSRRKKQEK